LLLGCFVDLFFRNLECSEFETISVEKRQKVLSEYLNKINFQIKKDIFQKEEVILQIAEV
jgi:hypothetical protein